MKKNNSLISVIIIVSLILLGMLCVSQLKINRDLSMRLSERRKELAMAEDVSRRLDELEKEDKDIKQKQEAMSRKVPFNEKHPFNFIRALIQAGTSAGLKEIKINMVKDEQPIVSEGFIPIRMELACNGAFSSLSVFLEQLTAMERLINVDMLKVERDEKLLPNQTIYLQLLIYTFPQ